MKSPQKTTNAAATTVLSSLPSHLDIESAVAVKSKEVPHRGHHAFQFWQRVVEIAARMPTDQAIKIRLREHGSYERVRSGLYHAARKLGVGITLTHEERFVYVERVIHVEKVVISAP